MSFKINYLFIFIFPIIIIEFIITGNRDDTDSTFNIISLTKYLLLFLYVISYIFSSIIPSYNKKKPILQINANTLTLFLFIISIIIFSLYSNDETGIIGTFKIILILISCYFFSISTNKKDLLFFWSKSIKLVTPLIVLTLILGLGSGIINGMTRNEFFIFNLTHFLPYVIVLLLFSLFVYCGPLRKTIVLILISYIILTASRGGIIALLFSIFICSIFFMKENFLKKISKVFTLFVLSFLALTFLLMIRSNEINNITDEPYRYKLLDITYHAILEKPLMGNGYLSFVGKSQELARKYRIDLQKPKSTHNTQLEILYSFGIISYMLFLILQLNSFFTAKKAIVHERKLSLFYIQSIIYLGIHSFTTNMESSPLFWFILLTASSLKIRKNQ